MGFQCVTHTAALSSNTPCMWCLHFSCAMIPALELCHMGPLADCCIQVTQLWERAWQGGKGQSSGKKKALFKSKRNHCPLCFPLTEGKNPNSSDVEEGPQDLYGS